MLRDYEDENGNVVLYFDDVSPYTPTKKHKIELDPVMREEFSRSVRQIVHASSHYKYERNINIYLINSLNKILSSFLPVLFLPSVLFLNVTGSWREAVQGCSRMPSVFRFCHPHMWLWSS